MILEIKIAKYDLYFLLKQFLKEDFDYSILNIVDKKGFKSIIEKLSAKGKLKANKTPYKLYSLYKALNYNSDIMSVILDLNLTED